jgi:hypothetical protein
MRPADPALKSVDDLCGGRRIPGASLFWLGRDNGADLFNGMADTRITHDRLFFED